ncbi:MAG: Blp family class II bacteriocin [Moraxella sp.]|nr:Blp family class II bacteriocin [Moraxella sp.]
MMRELTLHEIEMVSGGKKKNSTTTNNDACSWRNFGKAVVGGAVSGGAGGAVAGMPGVAFGATAGAAAGMAVHLGTCWW